MNTLIFELLLYTSVGTCVSREKTISFHTYSYISVIFYKLFVNYVVDTFIT